METKISLDITTTLVDGSKVHTVVMAQGDQVIKMQARSIDQACRMVREINELIYEHTVETE